MRILLLIVIEHFRLKMLFKIDILLGHRHVLVDDDGGARQKQLRDNLTSFST